MPGDRQTDLRPFGGAHRQHEQRGADATHDDHPPDLLERVERGVGRRRSGDQGDGDRDAEGAPELPGGLERRTADAGAIRRECLRHGARQLRPDAGDAETGEQSEDDA